jgi:hypothetical protein
MRRVVVVVVALGLLALGAAWSVAQESRPGSGGETMAQAGGAMGGHGAQPGGMMGPGGGMMGQGGMGGMMGMHGGGMRGRAHLEHLMVHNPKAAARVMRFRADMLKAMSEVLQRHAAELEKAQ